MNRPAACDHKDLIRVVRAKDVSGDCNVNLCVDCGCLIVSAMGQMPEPTVERGGSPPEGK